MPRNLHQEQTRNRTETLMDIDSEDGREPQEETAGRPRPSDPPPDELQLVEVRENPEWWRGHPGAHSEVH
jgi:hypothetical protein